jgi:predicted nucleotidyltransferase
MRRPNAPMDIRERVEEAIGGHPAVRRIQLVGSRARGDATVFSDWDFQVVTNNFLLLANDLSSLVQPLLPVATQWDRLSDEKCYMLVLRGPAKVDLLFQVANEHDPPWIVTGETLGAVDHHFWDWTLWLLAKEVAGKDSLVRSELAKLSLHLLEPMGVSACPGDIDRAVDAYVRAREMKERRYHARIPRTLEREVRIALNRRRSGAY